LAIVHAKHFGFFDAAIVGRTPRSNLANGKEANRSPVFFGWSIQQRNAPGVCFLPRVHDGPAAEWPVDGNPMESIRWDEGKQFVDIPSKIEVIVHRRSVYAWPKADD